MADVTTRVETYSNAGVSVATFGANYLKHVINQADVGRELIVKIAADAGMLNTELDAAIKYITQAGGDGTGTDTGGPDAFTVAAVGTAAGAAFVSGTTTVVYLRVQGTGTLSLAGVKAAAEAVTPDTGTTFTVTTEAVFAPAL